MHIVSDKDKTMKFFEYTKKMMHNSRMNEDCHITPDNVYQVAHTANRDILLDSVRIGHLKGSNVLGVENILKLNELAEQGKSCIVLSEHVSNLDVPSLFARFYDHPNEKLKEIFEKFIFVAGVKLNQNSLVKLYTEMFTRVVIYPIRSLEKMTDDKHREEVELAKKINMRATRKIAELRNKNQIFVMYPAGTRYRPWQPETKKGIKETTSYLNSFDYFCCASINGNNMPPRDHEDMTREQFLEDVLVFNFGEVKSAKEYITNLSTSQTKFAADDKENIKQYIVDNIMEEIDILHEKAEEYRKQYL
ncbi:MAG: hypothetical protein A2086_09245 [Spirochaetes bacterium GWD1_27_9]|nr:MAG: hypothetical protein A2Z98_05665 [Spirochaetes bacterium GWB1_27_13]OHD28766.1 MAG: hypothetical protein A2086_09245 [Spirochaetes bacterium GWD1_27_9]